MSQSFVDIVRFFFTILSLAIIGRALLSWFDPGFRSAVGKIIFQITEPVISPIRQFVPSIGMMDISPIIALLLIQFLSRLITSAIS